jgi:acetyltransferase-like isoleucine patch superfamily enzyme
MVGNLMSKKKSIDYPAPGKLRKFSDAILERLPARLVNLSSRGFSCEPGVVVKTPSRLMLGHGVTLQRNAILHCGGKAWCKFRGSIKLGNHVVVGPNCILYGAGNLVVGDFTHFGPGSMVMAQAGDADSDARQTTEPGRIHDPVTIGKGVWIGAGAVILGDTVLGDNCVVGPNSVVSGSYEAGSTLMGNPARVVRRRTVKETQ